MNNNMVNTKKELGIDELREGFLRYTVEAYRMLNFAGNPRILEVGCGEGVSAIELAEISGGEITGIDVDEAALSVFREKPWGNKNRVKIQVIRSALGDFNPSEKEFDIIWEEGVFHLLDLESSLKRSRELLRPGGFLVSCETLEWFKANINIFESYGFILKDKLEWEKNCWWEKYYAPLEERITGMGKGKKPVEPGRFEQYKQEIEMVRKDPGKFDCGHYIFAL